VIHNNLGLVYAEQGRYEEAINEYRQALEKDRNFVMAYNNLGLAFAGRGQLDAAIDEFRKALVNKP